MPVRQPLPPHPLLQTQREEPERPFIPPDIDYEDEDEEEEREREQRANDTEDTEDESEMAPHDIPRGPPPKQAIPQRPQRPQKQELIPLRVYKFRPSKDGWKHITLSGALPRDGRPRQAPGPRPPCTQLRIISWNIDMSTQQHEERLAEALRHLESDVLASKAGEAPPPCMILLQEVHMHVVPYLLRHPWVRRYFAVTPFTTDKWPRDAFYGNLTLVSRMLDVYDAHILHFGFNTDMERTALCVKVRMTYPGTKERAVLAIVNTHLESLPRGAAARPKQLELCSRFLRLKGVEGGVVAGDMNALGPGDATIGKDFGLRDAWRRGNGDERGVTWGFQGQNEGQHPPNRLDKIYYLPGMRYKVDEPRRIGIGLKIGEGRDALWVSDHYGLDTTLHMKERSQSS
ncbi:hypothetical protein HYPSUDRAFT_36582 [Hypholoma sublateritium FD-334 SS-4]|uniref:Endonuclease/exonuclease/phosphatase domain-containing protein n=1 Tax=Hypholoma sublateritium (strain FD-334 SS-4) TaxID=945553 RepID=A0A0D2P5W4_HYPSF|nr:hypothetical protein HYPSUDRAFT_36582 [Hypholoma sublateritium FD-334 SS-4]